jgi:hypothetical protein
MEYTTKPLVTQRLTRVVGINRNRWSASTETGGRHQLKQVDDIN